MRRAARWVFGAWEESTISLAGTLRKIGLTVLFLPPLVWILDERPPLEVFVWSVPIGLGLIALANWRWSKVEHAVEVYEARPRRDETGDAFAMADCTCGWEFDADTLEEALAKAREHSNTGDPVVVRDSF